ncbi:MAG: hypothetical protein ACREBU_02670 [Nitrososphaera sp.]
MGCNFDAKCRDLAEYYLDCEGSRLYTFRNIDALAQAIQDTVDDMIDSWLAEFMEDDQNAKPPN